jgi:hypothetical protein
MKNVTLVPVHTPVSRQCGASLLEGIAYLGIAALVVLGAVSLLAGAFGSAKSNQTTEEVVALRTAVRKLFIGQSYGNQSLLPTLIVANAIPNTLSKDTQTNQVANSWGGQVTVQGNGGAFQVTYQLVPTDVCIGMLSGANGWTQISQGGTQITTFPVSPQQAQNVCNVAAGNAVTFTAS